MSEAPLKKERRERPLSPHLSIYKPQITSMMSIMHRLTGVFNLLGLYVFAVWLVSLMQSDAGGFEQTMGFITSWFGMLLLMGWTISIFYHLFNGIRHLVWDSGRGVNIVSARRSGTFVIFATILAVTLYWANYLSLI